ncbi:DUF6603 domain-containing protein [Streptomyces sioyaensis]|uniref:DUF6603 domain-containing protein n=1 Tax=Streptomyces sioyaensis TaxID=67364 RepID=UPI00379038A4
MPLLVSTLRTVLREAQDLSFLQIVPDFLELEPALELFQQHLANALLDMREVTVNEDALHVTGTVTLVGQAASAGSVLFLADEDEQYVVGFCLDVVLLPDGPGLPEELREIPAVLERLRLGSPHLVLGIEPGGDSGARPRVGLGLEVLFPTPDATPRPYVWGYPPLWPGQAWQVGSNFADVPIPDLDSLLVFAGLPTGYLNLPPDIVELVTRLALTALGVTFAPDQSDRFVPVQAGRGVSGDWLALWLRVDLDAPWKPLPGIIELDDLYAEFTLANPLDDDRHLATVLGGRVTLAEKIVVDVGVALPDRSLSGILARPAPLGAMLQQRFPGVPVPQDLTVTELALWAELAAGPGHGYGLGLTLESVWHFADGIELTDIILTVADRGGIEASLTASWRLGDGTLDVTGTWSAAAGWTITARALDLQPADVMSSLGITVPEELRGLVFDVLAVTIDSAGHFTFECAAAMPVGDVDAQFIVTVDIDRPSGTTQVAGVLRLMVELADGTPRVLDFIVAFSSDSDGSTLTAAWIGEPGIGARELAGAVGLGIPAGVPATLLPTLTSLALRRDSVSGRLLVASATLAGGGIALAALPGGGLVLLVQAAIPARLSDLPLVGGQIPPDADIGVTGIQLLVTRTALSPDQIDAVNGDLEAVEAATGQSYPRLPAPEGGLPKGAALTVPYEIAGQAQDPLTIAFGGSGGGSGSGQLVLRADGPPAGEWVDIGRSFGPLHVYRIGLGYDNSKVLVLFDAALGAAGLTIGVRGLGIALDLDTMQADARLAGLSIELERKPLYIAGAFVNRQPPPEDYRLMVEGMLVVEMPRFGALALGAYQRRNDGMTSLFAFGRATGTFGGPPPFRVTGFALGFGFNSGVRVPEQEEIAGFPLVSGLEPGSDLTDDPLETLALLTDGDDPWVKPVGNQIWLAGGLDFTSFEFIQARVLLLLEAGNDLTLALIGRAAASFPKKGKAYARIGVDLRVVYQSARGELAATAQLVDSYVIDPACVLTGGFAFYLWSGKSKYAGDFVVTVGGYHPHYNVPGHFPAVPRLGFTWSLGSKVSITGAAYFALTPNAVMAGGMLDVRYRSGNVEAWLTAKADILIQWAPLHFRAGISVTVGAKVKLLFTVRGELGASLDLWGPPTGGTVTAKFVFIKLTVKFGASLEESRKLKWPEFATQLLPTDAPLTATALAGLMADADADPVLRAARVEAGEEPWLLDPAGFSFAVSTVVPTKRVRFNNDADKAHQAVNIRPMGEEKLDGLLHVTVDYIPKGERGQRAQWREVPDTDKWTIEPQYGRVPFSLWGDPSVKDKDALGSEVEPMLTHITGLSVTVPAPETEGQGLGPIAEKDLSWERLDPDALLPLDPNAQPTGSPVRVAEPLGAGVALVADELATLGAASARTRLHGALAGLLGHDELPNGTLGAYAEQAGTLGLEADPLLLVEDAAPPAPEPVVFVLDDTACQALAVAPETGAIIGRIAVGQPGPYLTAASADGARLYAVGVDGRQVSVLDTAALRALAPRATTLSGQPAAFAVTRDGSRALVARPSSWAAGWVDLTGAAEPTTTVLDQSDARSIGGLAIDVEAARLHITVRDAGKAVSYDAANGSRVGEAFGPSSTTLITPGAGAERMYVYGASATGKGAVQVVPVPGPQYRPWGFDATGTEVRLLTAPNLHAVLLRRQADGTGHVITFHERQASPPETTLVSQVGVGADPRLLALDPLGRPWVLHADAVSVVQGSALLGVVDLAATPTSVTFTPDGARAFVSCADTTIAFVAVVEVGDAGPQVVDRWTLPPGTVPSAALFTVFTATASKGAAR